MIEQKKETKQIKKLQSFKDKNKHQHLMKIIIQTLYNLGYQKSANQLQHESDILYMKPQIKFMKIALPEQKYEQVQNYWKQINFKPSVLIQNILNELKCMKYIRDGEIEKALMVLQQQEDKQAPSFKTSPQKVLSLSESKINNSRDKVVEKQKKYLEWQKTRERLAQEIMIGDGLISQQQLQQMHDFIIEKSLQSDIQPRAMDKILGKFIQLQKMGLTSSLGFKLIQNKDQSPFDYTLLKNPPNKTIDKIRTKSTKQVKFIKFCPSSSATIIKASASIQHPVKFILTVCGIKKQKYLTFWELCETYGLQCYPNYKIKPVAQHLLEIPEQIIHVTWCQTLPQFIIATKSTIIIFYILISITEGKVEYQIQQIFSKKLTEDTDNHNTTILCAEFNFMTNLIYVGSSVQSIMVYNQDLSAQMLTIQPFFRTRMISFLFSSSVMLAVSATKPILVLYNPFQMQQISRINLQQLNQPENSEILSLRIQTDSKVYASEKIEQKYLDKKEECLIVVTQKNIYYMTISYEDNSQNDNCFSIRYILKNPFATNGQLSVVVQSMIYAGKYLISLGEKQFHSYQLPTNQSQENNAKKQSRWNNKQSFTFDVDGDLMISGDLQLFVWGYEMNRNQSPIAFDENCSFKQNKIPNQQFEEYEDYEESIQLEQLANLGVDPSDRQIQNSLRPQQPNSPLIEINDSSGSASENNEDQDDQEDQDNQDEQMQIDISDSDIDF